MRPLRRGAGDPPETSAPVLPAAAAAPRPCALAPSPCPAFPPQPAPRRPDTKFAPGGSATAQSPDRCIGRAVSRDQGRATSEGRTRTLRPAARRRNLAVPLPLPCGERDVDRRRVDPGEAPKLQPVFWLRRFPLPHAPRSEEHPFPGPSSSLECCKRRARRRGRSWGQASTGPGRSDEFGFSLRFCGHPAQSFLAHSSVLCCRGVGPVCKVRLDRKGPQAVPLYFWSLSPLPAQPLSLRFLEASLTHTSFPGLAFLSQASAPSLPPNIFCLRDPTTPSRNVRVSPTPSFWMETEHHSFLQMETELALGNSQSKIRTPSLDLQSNAVYIKAVGVPRNPGSAATL